ncbi:MAG TPA: hypothetical protein VMG35_18965 [Bryobacteraceae bacterium]|nr:hypothetical protein [Bryobacteraceae bacterium]
MQRDFVIQIRPDADVRAGQLEGRVEHIDSGRSSHFKSVEELVAFLTAMLAADEPSDDLTAV